MAEKLEQSSRVEETTQKDKFLTFVLGKEAYGIEIKYVTEIIGIQAITEIPHQPHYVKGIMNLRGKIIPVIDVRLRFVKEEVDYNDRTCIIVIDIKDISVGLIVDSVAEVISIAEQEVVSPPQINQGTQNRFVKGVGKVGNDVKLILDCERLLGDEDIEGLSN